MVEGLAAYVSSHLWVYVSWTWMNISVQLADACNVIPLWGYVHAETSTLDNTAEIWYVCRCSILEDRNYKNWIAKIGITRVVRRWYCRQTKIFNILLCTSQKSIYILYIIYNCIITNIISVWTTTVCQESCRCTVKLYAIRMWAMRNTQIIKTIIKIKCSQFFFNSNIDIKKHKNYNWNIDTLSKETTKLLLYTHKFTLVNQVKKAKWSHKWIASWCTYYWLKLVYSCVLGIHVTRLAYTSTIMCTGLIYFNFCLCLPLSYPFLIIRVWIKNTTCAVTPVNEGSVQPFADILNKVRCEWKLVVVADSNHWRPSIGRKLTHKHVGLLQSQALHDAMTK